MTPIVVNKCRINADFVFAKEQFSLTHRNQSCYLNTKVAIIE